METPRVIFEGVWKRFRRGERQDSLRDLIPALARRLVGGNGRAREDVADDQEFWALADVNFEVREGEALGIIGRNGAGKSTILKLLTRILKPTRGACAVIGRSGALIEVAAGFHPDLTGRENVYLQGALMGMSRGQIAKRFDEIVGFAGVDRFIDTQVKRYSTGMNARLGFSIAAHLAVDFTKGAVCEGNKLNITKRRMKVIQLGANGSKISAWANDRKFDEIYFQELRTLTEGSDNFNVLALTCSGNSPNIVNLVEHATREKAKVMGIVGFTGGDIAGMCEVVHVKSEDYGIVEDVAHKIMHWTTQRLRDKILYGRT